MDFIAVFQGGSWIFQQGEANLHTASESGAQTFFSSGKHLEHHEISNITKKAGC